MNKGEAAQGLCAVLTYISSRKISFWEKFLVLGFVLLYIVSPVDFIPDVPVMGWLDDIGVGALFIAFCNYRVSHLVDSEPDRDVIDVSPSEDKPVDSNRRLPAASEDSSPFFTKKKTSADGGGNKR